MPKMQRKNDLKSKKERVKWNSLNTQKYSIYCIRLVMISSNNVGPCKKKPDEMGKHEYLLYWKRLTHWNKSVLDAPNVYCWNKMQTTVCLLAFTSPTSTYFHYLNCMTFVVIVPIRCQHTLCISLTLIAHYVLIFLHEPCILHLPIHYGYTAASWCVCANVHSGPKR